MKLTADQIIQLIVDQTTLPEVEVFDRIQHLQRSFNYPLDQLEHDNDPTFPKLLAQELNVDLGVPPYDYLYPELLFDEAPLILRIIPFSTVDKSKIKTTLRSLVLELEDAIKYHYLAETECLPDDIGFYSPEMRKLLDNQSIGLNEELLFLTNGWTFVRDGIWILFHSYSTDIYTELYFKEEEEGRGLKRYLEDFKAQTQKGVFKKTLEDFNVGSLANSSLEDIIDRSELYRTFTDNRIIRTSDPNITFIPYSLVHMVMVRPPDWGVDVYENRDGNVQFPYVTLESLRTTPNLEIFEIHNPWAKEIVGTEALQYCRNLKMIIILDEMGTLQQLQFPPDLSLPNLEHFEIDVVGLSLDEYDLSFLNNSPKLQILDLYIATSRKKLILPPFDNHLLLEEIKISAKTIGSIVLSSPWRCPNLRRIRFGCNLESLDLTPLKHCAGLRELILSSNNLKTLDLSPLRHCVDLQTLSLSNNLLNTIDLSLLSNHPALESIDIEGNLLPRINLSPLLSCPNLNTIILKDNPIANIPKDILDQQDPAVLLAYDSLLC